MVHLVEGKEILENEGFGKNFDVHAVEVDLKIDKALEKLSSLL